jgi:GNAT superfamily N-acetyltransferase
MSVQPDPRRIPMTVTFLEMTAKPSAIPPPMPRGKIAFLKSENPPVHFYRYLYDTVGGKYFWVDRRKLSDGKLAEIIQAPTTHLYVLYTEGTPGGMAELDFRADGSANIAYFGLMPDALGKRLGYFFLYQTCVSAWAQPISKLLVNTCTLDHPRALPLYQRMGFRPYSREERFVELP